MGNAACLRIVFCGTHQAVAARHLAAVAAAHSVVAIFETSYHQGWRRAVFKPRFSRLKRFARRHAVPYQLIDRGQRKELPRLLSEHRPDVVCIVSMAYLLPPEALAVPTLGTINLHPSLLPAYRGGNPLFWQVFDGVEESGVTVHLVDEKEDHGPILVQHRFAMESGITHDSLQDVIGEHGPPALLEAIDLLAAHKSKGLVSQPERSPTRRARGISRQQARELIDWRAWSIERVWRLLRGARPLLGLPPTRLRDLGRCPRIETYQRIPTAGPPGSLQRDANGTYLAHPEGRIRISYAFAPREWFMEQLILLRGLKRRVGNMFR
jgi:methionyl-tRNA formyltransferase